MVFRNREEAGRLLAGKLLQYRNAAGGLILALPRGGVAVGYQLSLALHLPLEVFITRKIGAPGNPEYALGAVSETGAVYINQEAATAFRFIRRAVEELAHDQRREISRRQALYRQGRHLSSLEGRLIIIVDDGIATGATFFASVEAIRQQKPSRLVAAIPVGPEETIVTEPFWT